MANHSHCFETLLKISHELNYTDVNDALMSIRCYKKAWDEQKVLDEIEKNSGIEFDPFLVTCFFDIYETIKAF